MWTSVTEFSHISATRRTEDKFDFYLLYLVVSFVVYRQVLILPEGSTRSDTIQTDFTAVPSPSGTSSLLLHHRRAGLNNSALVLRDPSHTNTATCTWIGEAVHVGRAKNICGRSYTAAHYHPELKA